MTHRWDPVVSTTPALVRPVRRDPTGQVGPTRGEARGPRWRRTSFGYYVPSGVSDECVEQRILEQSMRITATGAVTGWAALRLHGAAFFDGVERDGWTRVPVPITAGTDRLEPSPAIVRTRARLDASEVTVRHGIRCTVVRRAVLDELRRLTEARERVVAIDMAAAAELTSLSRTRAYLGGARAPALLIAALELADEHSRSPAETRFRLIWELDAGWPRPLVNRPVFDLHGRFLGIPDLVDVEHGIVGEYDGADHRTRARHTKDVQREAGFRAAGLEYVEAVGADLHHPPRVVARMEQARARSGRGAHGWTIERDS